MVLLKKEGRKVGVSCTFLKSARTEDLKEGKRVTIKGVLRAGAGYDEDLGLYEDAILDKCDLYTGKE